MELAAVKSLPRYGCIFVLGSIMSTCHATHGAASASTAKAREFLSLKEVTVIADIPEARVRKDIETGLLPKPRVVYIADTRLCFAWPHVFALAAVYSNNMLNAKLRKLVFYKVKDFASSVDIIDCWNSHSGRSSGKIDLDCYKPISAINIDRFVMLDVEKVLHSIGPRVGIYWEGLTRIEEKDDILGGNAVFKGTRLPVMHIGKMALDGEPIEAITEDYPYLNEDDVSFAKLYYKAHPSLGRPRAVGDHKDAKSNT